MVEGGSEKSIQDLEAEKKELLERLSYAMAELANMRRIMEKEISRAETAVVERIMKKFIVFYEDFETVVKKFSDSSSSTVTLEAMNMLLREFENILSSEGVERMDVVGKEFNPFDHEAAEVYESDEVTVETVVEVLSNGYRFKDKILKPPKVKVAKPKKTKA